MYTAIRCFYCYLNMKFCSEKVIKFSARQVVNMMKLQNKLATCSLLPIEFANYMQKWLTAEKIETDRSKNF